jgi:hypothetical protein
MSQPALIELLKSQVIGCAYFVKERPDMIAREDLDDFKRVLCRKCVAPEPGAELMPLVAALRHKCSSQQAEIVRGIVDGRITVYGYANDPFGEILVERPRHTRQAKARPAPKAITHLTQAMTMRRYGLWQNEAKAILRCLGSRQMSRGGMRPVEIARIEGFFEEHTLIRQIARQHGLLSLQLTRALRRHRPGIVLSLAPRRGQEVISAILVRSKDISYVRGVARRLAKTLEKKIGRGHEIS